MVWNCLGAAREHFPFNAKGDPQEYKLRTGTGTGTGAGTGAGTGNGRPAAEKKFWGRAGKAKTAKRAKNKEKQ